MNDENELLDEDTGSDDDKIQVVQYAQNGIPVQDRCKIIEAYIEPRIDDMESRFEAEYQEAVEDKVRNPKKKTINSYMVKCWMYGGMMQLTKTDPKCAVNITAEQLQEIFNQFVELTLWLNSRCVFTPSKQTFVKFAGLTISIYNDLLLRDDTDLHEVISSIEAFLVDLTMSSAENGITNPMATKMRLQARSQGHSIVSATSADSLLDKATEQISSSEAKHILDSIIPAMLLADSEKK